MSLNCDKLCQWETFSIFIWKFYWICEHQIKAFQIFSNEKQKQTVFTLSSQNSTSKIEIFYCSRLLAKLDVKNSLNLFYLSLSSVEKRFLGCRIQPSFWNFQVRQFLWEVSLNNTILRSLSDVVSSSLTLVFRKKWLKIVTGYTFVRHCDKKKIILKMLMTFNSRRWLNFAKGGNFNFFYPYPITSYPSFKYQQFPAVGESE